MNLFYSKPQLVLRARIELRNVTIKFKDGLSGTGLINEPTTPPADVDTEVDVDAIVLNTTVTTLVPIGARFTVASSSLTYTVTGRTPSGAGPTTNIVFTPAWGSGNEPANDDVVTFLAQEISIVVGDGNLTYTESKDMLYELDRGDLNTVKEGDQIPMDVNLDMVWEQITTGTGETVTPVDALKGINGASEWVNAATDICEPYAIDIEVLNVPPCGTTENEQHLFPDFRFDSLEFDVDDSSISVTGRCNATQPTITRNV